jgi:biopolymer transport protein ExbB/TolQ
MLYALFAFTVALVLYKTLELWAPRLLGRPGLAAEFARDKPELDEAMEQHESGLTMLAVIGSSAPFLGLLGTVMHIIVALRQMGHAADMNVISGPIALALTATLVGLAAAIPAAVAYNLMQRRLQRLHNAQLRRLARQAPEAAA